MILCDVGNSRMHLFRNGRVEHLSHEEGLRRYAGESVCFISVNVEVTRRIEAEAPAWCDLSACRILATDYRGLGIDREAACLGVWDGVVVDAGSAVTVDIVDAGRHRGGWIWPGIGRLRDCYAAISPSLRTPLEPGSYDRLPNDTSSAVAFGILGTMALTIERFREGRRIVLTGGDAPLLAPLLPEARIDETVVFKGMQKMIKDNAC